MQVIDELEWSEPTAVKTKNGPRNVRSAPATTNLWNAWKSSKAELQQLGISVSRDKETNVWTVKQWTPADSTPGNTQMTRPLNEGEAKLINAFPGAQVEPGPAPADEFKPELPQQGYRGMVPRDRFAFDLRCACVRALETERCSRDELIQVMREIAIDLKR